MKFFVFMFSALNVSNVVLCFIHLKWTPEIEIAQGRLRGVADRTHNKYLGIPYAKVVTRYQAAKEAPSWQKTFYAIQDKNCKQISPILKLPFGTEDCLILNVYTPKYATPEKPVPVMVYVHGGGFYYGSSSSLLYGPEELVEKGVIVVTITYRLGAAGFLCLKTKGAPGNAGLKDQVSALRWVKQNINAFGGDPSSVTIFGESAGATSVHLLILSRMAEGLFHRAILESNTALSPISFTYEPIDRAIEIAERLGYKTKDLDELLAIYLNTSMADIVKATDSEELLKKFNFVPCAEKEIANIEPFLTKTPYEVLRSGKYIKVPMMIGWNEREGTLFVGMLKQPEFAKLSSNFELLLPRDLNFKSSLDMKEAAKAVREFYFGNASIEHLKDKHIEEVIDLATDAYFHYSNVKSSELNLIASDQPLYNYYFTYDSKRNLGKVLSRMSWIRGATHIDETFYLFNPSFRLGPLTGRDLNISKRMTQLWTEFAKTSNPTPTTSELIPNIWTPSSQGLQFYNLDDDLYMRDLPNQKRMNFWRAIYDKYGYKN